jgi:hypothetical protein
VRPSTAFSRTETSDSNLGVGYLAGRLEDNATPNLDGVVGEAFVEPSQKSDIDGGLHAVRPFLFFEQSEQVLVKFVDNCIVTADLCCPFGITG